MPSDTYVLFIYYVENMTIFLFQEFDLLLIRNLSNDKESFPIIQFLAPVSSPRDICNSLWVYTYFVIIIHIFVWVLHFQVADSLAIWRSILDMILFNC